MIKRIAIVSTIAALLLLTAFVVVRAETRHGRLWSGHHWHRFGPAGSLAHELNLSPAQRSQIHTLWQAQQPALSAQLHDLLAENKQMDALAASASPNQDELQKAADREAKTLATLLMEKSRLESQIDSTVLDARQRARAQELRNRFESHLDRFADRLGAAPAQK